VYRWERYDTASRQWVTESTFAFSINGGRAGGYRGWSVKTLTPGAWRCDVETPGGALIGRISFTATEGQAISLSTTTL
jgi:hypothetical protein